MASTLCILLVFLSCVSISFQKDFGRTQFSNPESQNPKSVDAWAEKLIRSFNLVPNHEGNIHVAKDLENVSSSGIVEKQFKLSLEGDPGNSIQDLAHHTGYYSLPDTIGARMFYFFFESRGNKTDPVVIWLSGGPGCGSELALFFENGPFNITSNSTLAWNDFGWDKVSNIIYVDQPTGTGFSYSSDERDMRSDEEGVSNDLYNFLLAFFQEHPQYANNDFFITGESYAGHYIPALASRIHQGNKNNEGIHINMKGFAIGNGFTNPVTQYKTLPDFALNAKLINQSDYNFLQANVSDCENAAKTCGGPEDKDSCSRAFTICCGIFDRITKIAGNINFYDIRKQCDGDLCYNLSYIVKYLNQDSVRQALGVGAIKYDPCRLKVHQAMQGDMMRDLSVRIPEPLDLGIKVLVYAGEYDLICNWFGISRWVNELVWSGQKQYAAAKDVSFTVNGMESGVKKEYGPLTFLKVHNAGHLVPMDQPQASLEMIRRWTRGLPL